MRYAHGRFGQSINHLYRIYCESQCNLDGQLQQLVHRPLGGCTHRHKIERCQLWCYAWFDDHLLC